MKQFQPILFSNHLEVETLIFIILLIDSYEEIFLVLNGNVLNKPFKKGNRIRVL